MTNNHLILLILAVVSANNVFGQDKWVWPRSKNQKILGYYPAAPKKVYYTDEFLTRGDRDRDREPTTRKPLPGQPANDEIEDYPDNYDQNIPEKQNSPYIPPAGVPGFGGGFNQYPQFAGGQSPAGYPSTPGVLVGPGGPSGVIGRPQVQYPNAYPGQVGYPGYPSYNSNFPGYNGIGQQYYPGQQQPAAYPHIDPQQQFGGGTTGQYPGYGHQYTEGYGFPNYHPQLNGYPGAYPGYQGAFDEHPAQTQDINTNVKANRKKIDDKVSRNTKKS